MDLRRIVWSKVRPINIWYVIQSWYWKRFKRDHIQEQVDYRISLVKEKHPECLEKGYCYCGCDIPDMFYSDKPCDNNCYPPLMNKKDWFKYDKLNRVSKNN